MGAALELDQNHPRKTQAPGTMGPRTSPAPVQATKTQDSASLDVSQNTPEVFIQRCDSPRASQWLHEQGEAVTQQSLEELCIPQTPTDARWLSRTDSGKGSGEGGHTLGFV